MCDGDSKNLPMSESRSSKHRESRPLFRPQGSQQPHPALPVNNHRGKLCTEKALPRIEGSSSIRREGSGMLVYVRQEGCKRSSPCHVSIMTEGSFAIHSSCITQCTPYF